MKKIETKIKDCFILEPDIFGDDRGFFLETYQKRRYKDLGINYEFVQDNYSRSSKGILRGLHFQKKKPQGKLVTVSLGEVYDVAVDLREKSNTFGQWASAILSEDNKRQFWIPPGFAHGFLVISDSADFHYKCTDYYDKTDEGSISWDDPTLAIDWPINDPVLSIKDSNAPSFEEFLK